MVILCGYYNVERNLLEEAILKSIYCIIIFQTENMTMKLMVYFQHSSSLAGQAAIAKLILYLWISKVTLLADYNVSEV